MIGNLGVYESSFRQAERIMALYTYQYQLMMQWYWRREQNLLNHFNFQNQNWKEFIEAVDYVPPRSVKDFFSRERPPHVESLFDDMQKTATDIMDINSTAIAAWARRQTNRKFVFDLYKEKMVQRARYISMQFVHNLTVSRRELYRKIFSSAFASDLSVAELKALLRPSMVLTPRLAFSVKNAYQKALEDMGKREALGVARALSERIKLNRLNAIVRTETIKCFWHGHIQTAAEMIRQGLFEMVMKMWTMGGYNDNWPNSTENSGHIVGIYNMFPSGDYIEDMINGRCIIRLIFFKNYPERFRPRGG